MVKLWLEDVKELYTDFTIWPCAFMSANAQYNSMTRFLIFYCVIIAYLKQSWIPLQVLLLVMMTFFVLYGLESLVGRNHPQRNTCSDHQTAFNGKKGCIDTSGGGSISYMSACRQPTAENPYMNKLLGDDAKNTRCVSSSADNEHMDSLMTKTLPKDDWDIMGKANSQRQFYTIPCPTGTCDSVEFANFLYNNPYS